MPLNAFGAYCLFVVATLTCFVGGCGGSTEPVVTPRSELEQYFVDHPEQLTVTSDEKR